MKNHNNFTVAQLIFEWCKCSDWVLLWIAQCEKFHIPCRICYNMLFGGVQFSSHPKESSFSILSYYIYPLCAVCTAYIRTNYKNILYVFCYTVCYCRTWIGQNNEDLQNVYMKLQHKFGSNIYQVDFFMLNFFLGRHYCGRFKNHSSWFDWPHFTETSYPFSMQSKYSENSENA